MLKINFNNFQNLLKQNKHKFPQLHCFEDGERFILLFKSNERWEYYTVVPKSEVVEFARLVNIPDVTGIDEFRTNYCSMAIELESFQKVEEITNPTAEPTQDEKPPIGVIDGEPTKPSSISKNKDIDPGEDVIDAADDYESLYKAIINNWQKKVMVVYEKEFDYRKKGLSDFKKKINMIMNIKPFLKRLPKIIRSSLKLGLKSVESELKVQIGYTENFEKKVMSLQKQELTGYMIDGKKWHGINGTTQDQADKIYNMVSEGVKNKTSHTDISKEITAEFNHIMPNQATVIARTETTRFLNSSKLLSYEESKIKGRKAWVAVMDDRTGELDKRMHRKYSKIGIPFDEEFVDDVTGKRFIHPPSRGNCRCIIELRLPKKE